MLKIHSNLSKEVHRVFDLEDFTLIFLFQIRTEFSFREDFFIHLSDVKVWSIVGSDAGLVIGMISRPVIVIKSNTEYLAVQKSGNFDALLHKDREILIEQEAGGEVILELDNVVYDKVQALDLIGSNSIIDGTGKVNSVSTFLCDLVFVNDWIQFIEVLVIAVI